MSVKATHWAWNQHSVKGNTKLILLALADHADTSCVCWPGLERIQEMTEATEKTVITCIQTLIELDFAKEIKRRTRMGRRRSSIYILNMDDEPNFGEIIDNGHMDAEAQDVLVGSIIDKSYPPVKITGSKDNEQPVDKPVNNIDSQPVKISKNPVKISESTEKISTVYKEVEPLLNHQEQTSKPTAVFATLTNPFEIIEKMGADCLLQTIEEWVRFFKLHGFSDGKADSQKCERMYQRWISDKVTLGEIIAVMDSSQGYAKEIYSPGYYGEQVNEAIATRNGQKLPKYRDGNYPFPESEKDFVALAKFIGQPAGQGELMTPFRARILREWHKIKRGQK